MNGVFPSNSQSQLISPLPSGKLCYVDNQLQTDSQEVPLVYVIHRSFWIGLGPRESVYIVASSSLICSFCLLELSGKHARLAVNLGETPTGSQTHKDDTDTFSLRLSHRATGKRWRFCFHLRYVFAKRATSQVTHAAQRDSFYKHHVLFWGSRSSTRYCLDNFFYQGIHAS